MKYMATMTPKLTFKVCILGDGGTGKTTLCVRVSTGHFTTDYKMTIGTTFFNYEARVDDSRVIFQIWDLGGQFQFRTLHDTFVKGAKALILTFDAANIITFMSLGNSWVPFIKKNHPETPIMLVSTKHDLPIANVPKDIIKEFTETSGLNFIGYLATSSKTGQNIEKVFFELAKFMKDKNISSQA
ncbi:MAG: Rab family GTPase [Candidatus Hodarchaeota archaeon]